MVSIYDIFLETICLLIISAFFLNWNNAIILNNMLKTELILYSYVFKLIFKDQNKPIFTVTKS